MNRNRRFSNAASANDNDFIGLGVTGWSTRWLIVSRHIEFVFTKWLLFYSHAQCSSNGTNYTRQHIQSLKRNKNCNYFQMTVQIVFVLRFKGIPPKLFGTNFFVEIRTNKEWKQKDLQTTSESKTQLKRPQSGGKNRSVFFLSVHCILHYIQLRFADLLIINFHWCTISLQSRTIPSARITYSVYEFWIQIRWSVCVDCECVSDCGLKYVWLIHWALQRVFRVF